MVEALHLKNIYDRPRTACLGIHCSYHNPRNTRLNDCPGTHLTWLQRDVHGTVLEPPVANHPACLFYSGNLSVRKRTLISVSPIIAAGYYFSIADNNTAYRHLFKLSCLFRLAYRLFHISYIIRIIIFQFLHRLHGHATFPLTLHNHAQFLHTQNRTFQAPLSMLYYQAAHTPQFCEAPHP